MKLYNYLVDGLSYIAVKLGNTKIRQLEEDAKKLIEYSDVATKLVGEYKKINDALNSGYGLLQDETDKLNRKHSVTIASLLEASGGAITVQYDNVESIAEKEFAIDFIDSEDGRSVTLKLVLDQQMNPEFLNEDGEEEVLEAEVLDDK